MTEFDKDATMTSVDYLDLLAKEMGDDDLNNALRHIKQLISKPDVPQEKLGEEISRLQAISARFSGGAVYYKTFGKSGADERYRKDVYYSMKDALDKLVDALKWQGRVREMRH